MKKLNKLPKFKTIRQENIYWQEHDSADYIDWRKAKMASFPNLKPSTETISLRLPEDLLNEIKILANKKDVPYQSLIKILLARGVHSIRKSI
jgi:predicted DNA binding CopG/RHH family protein